MSIHKITNDLESWTRSENNSWWYFRIDESKNRLYRKEINSLFYGGYKISYVSLGTPLADQWIKDNFN